MDVEIDYFDAHDHESVRLITIRSIKILPSGDFKVYAFCHTRNAIRGFKLSHIRQVIDSTSGEVYDRPIDFFNKFGLLDTAKVEEYGSIN